MKNLILGMLLTAALQTAGQQSTPTSNGAKDTKADAENCGLLYGKDHSLTFCAPEGWHLDNGIMNDQGIYAVFYPSGSNWDEAKQAGTIMYINVVAKTADQTVARLMEADAKDATRSAPTTIVKQGESIKVGELTTPVLRFAPGAFDRYEAVAYIGEGKVLVMFVVSSKTEEIFKKDYLAFMNLVQSYKFLSSNVTIEHK